jgi:O-antigen ligase
MNKASQIRIADFCFLAFFAILPFLDILASIVLGLMLVLGLVFKLQKSFFQRLIEQKGLVLLMLFFVIAVCSLSYTSDLGKSLERLSKMLAYILIPSAFLIVNPTAELIQKAMKVFIYSLIAFCSFSLLRLGYHLIVDYEISHWYNFVQDSMYHKRMPEDAMYLNTGLVLVLFGSFDRNFKLLVSFLFLTVIVLFGVRLGLFIYLLIVAIYFLKNVKELLSIKSLVIAVLAISASIMLIQQSRYVNDKFFDTLDKIGFNTSNQVSEVGENYHSINLRQKLWTSASELIIERPIFGYGVGDEKNELEKIYLREGYDIGRINAHNQFLSSLIQFGAVGLTLLVVVFFLLFRQSLREKSIQLFLVTLIMAISMITESYLELQQGVFYFCTFVTLFVLQKANTKPIEN